MEPLNKWMDFYLADFIEKCHKAQGIFLLSGGANARGKGRKIHNMIGWSALLKGAPTACPIFRKTTNKMSGNGLFLAPGLLLHRAYVHWPQSPLGNKTSDDGARGALLCYASSMALPERTMLKMFLRKLMAVSVSSSPFSYCFGASCCSSCEGKGSQSAGQFVHLHSVFRSSCYCSTVKGIGKLRPLMEWHEPAPKNQGESGSEMIGNHQRNK